MVKEYIDVAGGRAKFLRTETEDARGLWNDSYSTKEGYWVIHEGNLHHVYKLMKCNSCIYWQKNDGLMCCNAPAERCDYLKEEY